MVGTFVSPGRLGNLDECGETPSLYRISTYHLQSPDPVTVVFSTPSYRQARCQLEQVINLYDAALCTMQLFLAPRDRSCR